MQTIHVSMPLFNEAATIHRYLLDVDSAFRSRDLHARFVIVDDRSTDDSLMALRAAQGDVDLLVLRNDVNSGHGPSTLRALRGALEDAADFIVSTDSDGQFAAADVAGVGSLLVQSGADTVTVRRYGRDEERYRKVGTMGGNMLASLSARRPVHDSNCPLRAYRAPALNALVNSVPHDALVPSIMFSVLIRRSEFARKEVKVRWQPRLGVQATGTMWSSRSALGAFSRYARFCSRAARQFVSWKPTTGLVSLPGDATRNEQ